VSGDEQLAIFGKHKSLSANAFFGGQPSGQHLELVLG
jgi:hypothetical protein